MKNLLFTIITFLFCTTIFAQKNVADFVNPLIGTQGDGNTFIGTTVPFGMVKLGPDCGHKRYNSGYHHTENIHGFSHVHVSGTGGGAKYGNILVAPVTGELDISDYSSPRNNEKAKIGRYSVELTKHKVKAELTSTHSAGFHQYTFPASDNAHILIDAGSFLGEGHCCNEAQVLIGSEVEIISDTRIEGYSRIRGGWNMGAEYTVYFSAVFDTPAATFGVWKDGKIMPGHKSAFDEGKKTGAYFDYKTENGQTIQMKVGISFVSSGKARENLKREIPHWDFRQTYQETYNKWNEALGKVEVEVNNLNRLHVFYTALYHAMLMPTNRTGENPKWNSGEPYYDDFYAIWDTFRATHPLLTLIAPDHQVGIIRAMLDMYKYEGYMPDARSGNHSGRTQGGSNSDILIADAFVKGLEGIDYELAYQAMVKNAEVPPGDNEQKFGRGAISDYNKLGFISTDFERAGTRTVEYANCDWGIAQVAKGLKKEKDYQKYKQRASNWENLWRPIEHTGFKGFIMPRKADGTWVDDMKSTHWTPEKGQHPVDFTPLAAGTWGDFFYESHSWEYSLYVPHDMNKLIEKSGGKDNFVKRLDTFFDSGYFYIWNEPGFLTPCLYIYAGRHDKTAESVTKITQNDYINKPGGIPGNDDAGSMSSWYAFHAMGLFPNAGQDIYLITSPLFDKTTIHLQNGKDFTIKANNLSDENIYVKGATLNGKPYQKAWLKHSDLMSGSTLILEMGNTPTDWGSKEMPPSMSH